MADRFRLHEQDWERFERGDEWFVFDEDQIVDLDCDRLEAIEDAIAPYGLRDLAADYAARRVRGLRTAVWVARRLAGVEERWIDFKPKTLRMTWELDYRGGDGGGNSPAPDEGAPTDSPSSNSATEESESSS